LGIGNKTGAAVRLLRLQSFCCNTSPSTIDHKGETTTIYDEKYRDNPCSDEHVYIDKFTNALSVPARWETWHVWNPGSIHNSDAEVASQ